MNILDKICETTKERIEKEKQKISLIEVRKIAESIKSVEKENYFNFEKAIGKKEKINFICEIKKASPSKGIISEDFDYIKIAKDYQKAKADALSCLTEPHYFLGADEYLKEVKETVNIPILRKDFIIDEYMIYQSKNIKADAILLIAAVLDKYKLKDYFEIANSLGLSSLFEIHNEEELEKILNLNPRIIGVNNRNLKTFEVDINNSVRLRKLIPNNIIFVSESGIKNRNDIEILEENKTNAVLIGETLMIKQDKEKEIKKLRGIID
ncbi:indole-3-glycerol phosphate synthase TrpC [Brachyspira aalborgi]|uniref:indole-3-glycerol phosphate synthase TrpC n=1 Tax=Brachyspira aalborgi TaxID=29522 RepID=UPI0011C77166|nr:indole-3-glycerol phosphate synthase TrpC [Brachyspira aalborgi]TXJ54161.1 indole-3-glycerol phosphate synthase TrpC [Brachyspira aalborgi]